MKKVAEYLPSNINSDVLKSITYEINQKIKQGDLGSESGSMGKKEKVDASIFKKAEVRDY